MVSFHIVKGKVVKILPERLFIVSVCLVIIHLICTQNFRKTNISYSLIRTKKIAYRGGGVGGSEMLVFRNIWRTFEVDDSFISIENLEIYFKSHIKKLKSYSKLAVSLIENACEKSLWKWTEPDKKDQK